MMQFKERLKELRAECNLTQSALGKIVHTSKMGISHWESGHSEPSIAQLILLADYFDVSLDYLLGKEDYK